MTVVLLGGFLLFCMFTLLYDLIDVQRKSDVTARTFPINQPTRCNSFSSLLLDVYVQLNFGLPRAHHQELNNCSSSLRFYRWSVVVAVLLVIKFRIFTFVPRMWHRRTSTEQRTDCSTTRAAPLGLPASISAGNLPHCPQCNEG